MIAIGEKVMELRSQGLTYTQVGKRLGITRNAVSGICFRMSSPLYEQEKAKAKRARAQLDVARIADAYGRDFVLDAIGPDCQG